MQPRREGRAPLLYLGSAVVTSNETREGADERPLVAVAGEIVFLSEESEHYRIMTLTGVPKPVRADVVFIEAKPQLAPTAWAHINPYLPLFEVEGRQLRRFAFMLGRLIPLEPVTLRDERAFITGVVRATKQLELGILSPGPQFSLTPREREVLSGLAQGKALKQIGRDLGISEHTVKQHLVNARYKLGASDRITAVLLAIKRGLILFPDEPS